MIVPYAEGFDDMLLHIVNDTESAFRGLVHAALLHVE